MLLDHREIPSGIPAMLEAQGISVAPIQLPAGDYVLSDRLVVERKTGADLAASIKDRRLFEQVDRLRSAYAAVVLIVEGEPVHISEATWKGALGRALAAGVAVLQTEGADDSAEWLTRLYRQEERGPSEARGLPRVRRPTDDMTAVAQDVLTCLPGISTVGAQRLLAEFGSLREVFSADERELRGVTGIGAVRAGALARLFRAGAADTVDPHGLGDQSHAVHARMPGAFRTVGAASSRPARVFARVPSGASRLARQRGDDMADPVPAGSDVSAGTYKCTNCGYELDVGSTKNLPPCPSCHNGRYTTLTGGDSASDPYPGRK